MNCGIKKIQNRSVERMMSLTDSLREFKQLGCPVDTSVAIEVSRLCRLKVWQSGGFEDSNVFELDDGRFAFMLDLELYYDASKPMHIAEVGMRWPWKNNGDSLHWLNPRTVNIKNPQQSKTTSYQEYRFPGKSGLDLPADQVINHLLVERKILPARRPVSGWLLGIGGRIPKDLFHGGLIDARLVITTWNDDEICQPILLWTDRLKHRHKRPPRTVDLFGTQVRGRALENALDVRLAPSLFSKLGGRHQQG